MEVFQCGICSSREVLPINMKSVVFPLVHQDDIHHYEYLRCQKCGNVEQHPKMSDDELSTYYDGAYREYKCHIKFDNKVIRPSIKYHWTEYSFMRGQNFIDHLGNEHLSKLNGENVLDIGGYQGAFLSGLSNIWNLECTILDYSTDGLAFSSSNFGFSTIHIEDGLVQTLNQIDDSYGVVSMTHVFEHLKNPVEVLEAIKDVLKPNGILYIEVPNIYEYHLNDPTHVHLYCEESMKNLLSIVNMEVINISFTSNPIEPFEGFIDTPNRNLVVSARVTDIVDNCELYVVSHRDFENKLKKHRRSIAMIRILYSLNKLNKYSKRLLYNIKGFIYGY